MALSPDDKLLGEKVHYYCSSSEDEDDSEEHSGSEAEGETSASTPTFIPEPELQDYPGHSTNTGPKGVINDWRRFKQLEAEKKEEAEQEKLQLMAKLSLTCRSHLDDEKEKVNDDAFMAQLEELDDGFMAEYRQRRIEEMRHAFAATPTYGKVINVSGNQFIDAIDKEKPTVTIIMHIYEEGVPACDALTGCMRCLAQEYPDVKFCRIRASDAKLSLNFAENGVPALLVYKGGELIGNFIRLSDDLGNDFFANEVEGFLLEHGMLPDKTLKVPFGTIRAPADDDDSDFELD